MLAVDGLVNAVSMRIAHAVHVHVVGGAVCSIMEHKQSDFSEIAA